jgi:hypothetical protein
MGGTASITERSIMDLPNFFNFTGVEGAEVPSREGWIAPLHKTFLVIKK